MSAFEFTFSLFGLLLGFSLVEVLSGFVRTVKLRKSVRIGWLTPLLGVFVMVDLISFWSLAWDVREMIPATFAVLLFGLLITGVYYFSASMVFPEKPEEWPDFDAWAARHRRQVLGGVFFANLAVTVTLFARLPSAALTLATIGPHAGLLAVMLAAALVRSQRATGALLVATLLFYLCYPLLQMLR
jgi:hypothetical protein